MPQPVRLRDDPIRVVAAMVAAGDFARPVRALDPYAKAVDGRFGWRQSLFGYRFEDPGGR